MQVKKCDPNWRQHRPRSLGGLQSYEAAEASVCQVLNVLGQQWGVQGLFPLHAMDTGARWFFVVFPPPHPLSARSTPVVTTADIPRHFAPCSMGAESKSFREVLHQKKLQLREAHLGKM